MGSMSEAAGLSLKALEAVLAAKRRRFAQSKAGRFVAAEMALEDQPASRGQTAMGAARSPETWRGANGQDRHFRSLVVTPIDTSPGTFLGGTRIVTGSVRAWSPARRRARSWQDILLFAFEIIALVGFLVILGSSYLQLQALNREAREAMRVEAMPTVASRATLVPTDEPLKLPSDGTPPQEKSPASLDLADQDKAVIPQPQTPTMMPSAQPAELLPGGSHSQEVSTVPADMIVPTGTREPSAEVPEPSAEPTAPAPGPPRRLVIPKIDVDAPVMEGDSWEDLKKGIGHRPGTANPGEQGNVVVSAHNDVHGEIFRNLHKLEPGDEVLVYTDDGPFRYVVNSVEIVLPAKAEVMEPTDYPALTMITCYPYLLDTHRVVARAELTN